MTFASTFLALPFHSIDPIALELGPLTIRWYGIAYVIGFLFATWRASRLVRRPDLPAKNGLTEQSPWDILFWLALGVVIGGRLGYTFFYAFDLFLGDPLFVVQIWRGGMSFHGGFVGALVALWLYARKHQASWVSICDVFAAGAPVGIALGRVANFINGELWGRPSDLPWAMTFPRAGPEPRHPSQLYEALLEGVVLFVVLHIAITRFGALRRPGMVAGLFVAGYAITRILVEFVREPDQHIGFLFGFVTTGMALSVPLFVIAAAFFVYSQKRR